MPAFWLIDAWKKQAFEAAWEQGTGRNGSNCVSITISADTQNDVRWMQTVTLLPDTCYNLHGWIKGKNIVKRDSGDTGANLSLLGTWDHSANEGSFGTFG